MITSQKKQETWWTDDKNRNGLGRMADLVHCFNFASRAFGGADVSGLGGDVKRCGNCFETKSVSEFYPKREIGRKLSYQSRCKACNAEVVRGWKDRKKHGETKVYLKSKKGMGSEPRKNHTRGGSY